MKKVFCHPWSAALVIMFGVVAAVPASAADVALLQSQWAIATYEVDDTERADALENLADSARAMCDQSPGDAPLLIWKGIIVSSLAGEKGGLGALGLAKEAKASLEAALVLDPNAMQGSAYTSLGTLYHQVPGWPIGFGSDKKARAHLQRALAINPDGIDSNYFMGEFMLDEREYAQSKHFLLKALAAPARPGRKLADAGRREEAQQLLTKAEAKLD